MNDTYGLISKKLLAVYDQVTLSWRTLQDTLALDLIQYSQTLPKSGMTQHGKLYEQVKSARPITENDCLLLPTPLAHDAKGAAGKQMDLVKTMTLLATPTTNIAHTTGKCRNWGADLLHDVRCQCKDRRIHWMDLEG